MAKPRKPKTKEVAEQPKSKLQESKSVAKKSEVESVAAGTVGEEVSKASKMVEGKPENVTEDGTQFYTVEQDIAALAKMNDKK